MIAMAGKYIVDIKKSGLILTNPAGSSFDLTREDARELAVLISNWQRAMGMGVYEREPEARQTEELVKPLSLPVSEEIHYEG